MIILLIFWSFALDAQTELIRTIVLINGLPYMVDVTEEGDILEIYQNVPEYFSSTSGHENLVQQYSKDLKPQIASITFFEKQEEPVPSFSEENSQPIILGNNQYIGFSPERAILLAAAVDQIRLISESFQRGEIRNISITSYHIDTYRSRSLARNRASAIKGLLEAFGMPKSLITARNIDVTPDAKLDFLKVEFY